MEVKILQFPETKVAAIEHHGSPALEYDTARKLIAWKIEHRLLDQSKYRSYGVHYTDPRTTPASKHRVDFCLSFNEEVGSNPYDILAKAIPSCRCAFARDVGFRSNNKAAAYLYEIWLPQSGELPGDFPIFFHYVNVGPNVREEEMITDVLLAIEVSLNRTIELSLERSHESSNRELVSICMTLDAASNGDPQTQGPGGRMAAALHDKQAWDGRHMLLAVRRCHPMFKQTG